MSAMKGPSFMPERDPPDTIITTWWVGFKDGDHWWNRWLMKGFQHVELWKEFRFGPTENDRIWMHVNPAMEMVIHTVYWVNTPPWEREPATRFLRASNAAPMGSMRSWFHIGPFTCVDTVKQHLGMWRPFVITPSQLWAELKKKPDTLEHV